MKHLTIFTIAIVLSVDLSAQNFTVVGEPTAFDQISHLARTAHLSETSVGVEINNRFVSELNVLNVFVARPMQSSVISGMYRTFGYLAYREHSFSVGLSRKLTPRWALGLQAIPKLETFGKDYQSRFSMDLNATSFARLNQYLYWDSELNFPIRFSENTRNDAPLQSYLRMGLSYVFSKQCQLSVSVKQPLNEKTEINLQVVYSPIPALAIFGNAGALGDCGLGVQYVFGQMAFRLQTQYRAVVGYSTTFGVSYQLNKKTSQNDF